MERANINKITLLRKKEREEKGMVWCRAKRI
jgi:hypothetical protein